LLVLAILLYREAWYAFTRGSEAENNRHEPLPQTLQTSEGK